MFVLPDCWQSPVFPYDYRFLGFKTKMFARYSKERPLARLRHFTTTSRIVVSFFLSYLNLARLFTVPYFFARSSRSSACRYGRPSWFHMYQGGGCRSLQRLGEGRKNRGLWMIVNFLGVTRVRSLLAQESKILKVSESNGEITSSCKWPTGECQQTIRRLTSILVEALWLGINVSEYFSPFKHSLTG